MPTYQYVCTECDHAFEQFQSFTDDALTECPQCSGRLRKLFNAVGVVFKGSGFYRNDSRPSETSEKSEKSGKSEKPEKSATAGETSNGSSEKKSEKKSEPSKSSTTAAAGAS